MSMSDVSVKYFSSTMSGAPAMSGVAGALIGVLDGCLVDGFGSITLTTLAVASNVATASMSTGHQFTMMDQIGPVIRIAGATPSGLNGDWRITVTNATQFTFITTGLSDQTATGTITAKRAPAGFSKIYSGTNKAVYRSDDVTGSRFDLRVDDSTTGAATLRGYESMSDVDTGIDPFPTVAQMAALYARKSSTTDSVTRPWWLIADSKAFGLSIASTATYPTGYAPTLFFGDVRSAYGGDAYACAIMASASSANSGSLYQEATAAQAGHYLARSVDGLQKSINFYKSRGSYGASSQLAWMGSTAFSASASIATVATPLLVCSTESSLAQVRGVLPGLYAVHRHPTAGTHEETVSDGLALLMLLRGTHDDSSPTFTGICAVNMESWR
jgi:hypothetical protein